MLRYLVRSRDDNGAVAVLYAIVLVGIILPIFAVATTALVRTTTNGELQRAADAGALAGAAAIPFGDVNFARNFLTATAGGRLSDRRLRDLGLAFDGEDPLDVACDDVAMPNATDAHGLGSRFGSTPSCRARYLTRPDLLTELQDCAAGLASLPAPLAAPLPLPLPGLPAMPDLSPLLPALLYPGVQVDMSWNVTGPFDDLINGSGAQESTTAIAHRRFKNMVVVPEVGLPTGDTINLNPLATNVRNTAGDALSETEQLLSSNPVTADCATVLDGARDDLLDAVDPPAGGPPAQQVIDDAIATHSPFVVARVISGVEGLDVPYLDFVPVCAEYVGGRYVGHLTDFGACAIDAPGGFRASLRRS